VKEQAFYMKRAMDQSDLKGVRTQALPHKTMPKKIVGALLKEAFKESRARGENVRQMFDGAPIPVVRCRASCASVFAIAGRRSGSPRTCSRSCGRRS